MRRSWAIAGLLALLGGAFAWVLTNRPTRLQVGAEYAVVGLLRGEPASGSARAVVELLGQVASPAARGGLRAALSPTSADERHFGFGFTEPGFAVAPAGGPAVAHPASLPPLARQLLAATPNGYLLARTERPAELAAVGRRRGWFGGETVAVAARARAVTVAVGEGGFPRQVIALFLFEYESGEAAVAALATLGPGRTGSEASFTIPPGAAETARKQSVVTLRYEVAAALVEQAATRR